jgi:hypothetical protein
VSLREVSENVPRVIADGGKANPALSQLVDASLQLNELRAAKGSPIGGADEHQHRSASPHDRLQRLHASRLIAQLKVGHPLAHLRPERGDINPCTRALRVEVQNE